MPTSGEPARVLSELFVGREEQLDEFKKIITPESKIRILNIHSNGDGGIGKTQLLLRMQEYCKSLSKKILFTEEFIDFYHTEARSKIGIMHQIVENLGREHFPTFKKLIDVYHSTEDASVRQGMLPKLEEAFKSDYATFSKTIEKKIIVLFFDTYEVIQGDEEVVEGKKEATSTEMSRWIETELFSLFFGSKNTRIVVSGRYLVREVDHSQAYVKVINLEKLSYKETVAFWKRCFGIKPRSELQELMQKLDVNSEEQMRALYELTEGRPIFLALLADWVNYPRKRLLPSARELLNKTKREFERFLIEQISLLAEPEDRAVILMAIAYHRMTPEMFHFLVPEPLIPIEECREILLERLKPLSFIKYKGENIVLLHDEMRRLVIQHIWNQQDPQREMRKHIAADIVEFYDTEFLSIDNLSEELRETYTSELLEYALFANLEDGLQRFRFEFNTALEDGRYDYYELLLRELERYHRENPEELPFPHYHEIDLGRIRYNTYTSTDYEQSAKMANDILEKNQAKPEWVNSDLHGHFLFLKGTAKLWSGEYEEAVDSLKQAEQVFYRVGEYDWLHQTNIRIGYAYYRQGQFTEAEQYLEQSRDGFYRSLVQLEGSTERELRHLLQGLQLTLGNLAGVHSYTGQFERAVRKAEVTLNIVRNLPRNTLETARTRHSAGHAALYAGHAIDARHHFTEAATLLQETKDRLLTGRLKTELGFLQHRVNELAYLLEYYRAEEIEKIIAEYKFIQRTDIEKAQELVQGAIAGLKKEPVIKKELADAYYTLGELYMVTPSEDHWEKAEQAFLKSLNWGEESKFRYRVIDALESLVALYYFWHGASGTTSEDKENIREKMTTYQQELEESQEFSEKIYPELFAKYEVTLGDITFDEALEFLRPANGEQLDTAMAALNKAFTHYVSAADLMEGFNEKRYYLILRVLYNRLRTLIEQAWERKVVMKVIERLDDLQSVWAGKAKRFRDIYRGLRLCIQPEGKREEIADVEDHFQNVLEKGNFGWAALLNECLIGAYKSLISSEKENDDYREHLIVRLNAQSRFYRILGDVYQAEQNIEAARDELRAVSDVHLKAALEGYTDACEGTSKYRRGEYSKPLEFYLQDQLTNAREEKIDRQFPGARAEALRLLRDGERKLNTVIAWWQEKLTESDNAEEKALWEERIRRHRQRLGETRFRLGELLVLNEQFDDFNTHKGALRYLQEAVEDCENSGNTYYYHYALQSYVNALYFAGRYDDPEDREGRLAYEKRLEDNQHIVQPSIMGRLRITQGDALFSRYFERHEEPTTGGYAYLPRKDKTDTRLLQEMLHCYVEACDFMIQNRGLTQFDDAVRILQRRIELIGDRDTLRVIQHNLRDVWNYQTHLRNKADEELKTLDQFARIKGILLKQ